MRLLVVLCFIILGGAFADARDINNLDLSRAESCVLVNLALGKANVTCVDENGRTLMKSEKFRSLYNDGMADSLRAKLFFEKNGFQLDSMSGDNQLIRMLFSRTK